jgi:hypothetical protein
LKLYKLGGEASVHRQVAVLIVSLAGQEPPFFVEFTSAPLMHQKQEALLFRVFRCDLPIENVCEGL